MSDRSTGHVIPPKQSRSRRTLERIVAASLEILGEGGPPALTVQAVVERARSSVGSFYARFEGKDDLIDYLGERVWDDARASWSERVAGRVWSDLELSGLVEGSVRLLTEARRSREAYLSALDVAAGRGRDSYGAFRAGVLSDLEQILLSKRAEIAHGDPELAVRLGLRAVIGVIDGGLDLRDGSVSDEVIVEQCCSLLLGYLTGQAGSGAEGDVDFFDVWG